MDGLTFSHYGSFVAVFPRSHLANGVTLAAPGGDILNDALALGADALAYCVYVLLHGLRFFNG